jgi:predicted metal-dependent HD superfamily phosphohydrolase
MPALITSWTMDVRDVAPHAPPDDVVARAGEELLVRWNEPARRYHTTRHLVEMFGALEELEGAGEIDGPQCSVARLAAWFHDAIYDPGTRSGLNEEDSAALARDTLQELGFGGHDIDAIDRLIRLTARHDADGGEPLDAAFHDADLWILSAPQERFDGYCEQVREEYAHVPDPAYRLGRVAVLEPLAHRDTIYCTSCALHRWETPARINLGRELARLRAGA